MRNRSKCETRSNRHAALVTTKFALRDSKKRVTNSVLILRSMIYERITYIQYTYTVYTFRYQYNLQASRILSRGEKKFYSYNFYEKVRLKKVSIFWNVRQIMDAFFRGNTALKYRKKMLAVLYFLMPTEFEYYLHIPPKRTLFIKLLYKLRAGFPPRKSSIGFYLRSV